MDVEITETVKQAAKLIGYYWQQLKPEYAIKRTEELITLVINFPNINIPERIVPSYYDVIAEDGGPGLFRITERAVPKEETI